MIIKFRRILDEIPCLLTKTKKTQLFLSLRVFPSTELGPFFSIKNSLSPLIQHAREAGGRARAAGCLRI